LSKTAKKQINDENLFICFFAIIVILAIAVLRFRLALFCELSHDFALVFARNFNRQG